MEKCERCNRMDDNLLDSVFNDQMICLSCSIAESNHPLFIESKDSYNDEIQKGSYEFQKIGLPNDILSYYENLTVKKINFG